MSRRHLENGIRVPLDRPGASVTAITGAPRASVSLTLLNVFLSGSWGPATSAIVGDLLPLQRPLEGDWGLQSAADEEVGVGAGVRLGDVAGGRRIEDRLTQIHQIANLDEELGVAPDGRLTDVREGNRTLTSKRSLGAARVGAGVLGGYRSRRRRPEADPALASPTGDYGSDSATAAIEAASRS